jgi:hypothetical protein
MDQHEQDELQSELKELRAEVAKLQAERDAAVQAMATEEPEVTAAADDQHDQPVGRKAGRYTDEDFAAELQDLIEMIDKELKDTNPVTLLVVFALGAFVGRILPR